MPCATPPCCWPATISGLITAEIVRRPEARDLDRAGLGVDLDLAAIGAAGIDEVRRVVEGGLLEPGLHRVGRVVVRHVGGQRDLAQASERSVPATGTCRPRSSMSASAASSRCAANFFAFSTTLSVALRIAAPPTASSASRRCPCRRGCGRCRRGRPRSSFSGMPSRSATICAKAVSWPWPWLWVPVKTLMPPVGFTRTVAAS